MFLYTYVYIYIYRDTYTCMCVYIYIYMYTCIYIHIHIICICTYIYIYVYMHIYIYIYTHTHIDYMCRSRPPYSTAPGRAAHCVAGGGLLRPLEADAGRRAQGARHEHGGRGPACGRGRRCTQHPCFCAGETTTGISLQEHIKRLITGLRRRMQCHAAIIFRAILT